VALSSLRIGLPPFHYLTALAGGSDIRCASYETFGTPELATSVLSALDGRLACLMANHGLVALGKTMGDALGLAIEVEELCRQFLVARSVGDPILLTPTQMSEVRAKFDTYQRKSP
jgi:L-fuculose-phosphate aldolase